MNYGKIMTGLLSLVLVAVLLALPQQDLTEAAAPLPLEFLVQTDDGAEYLRPWKSPEGIYYLFLPSYADMNKIRCVRRGGH